MADELRVLREHKAKIEKDRSDKKRSKKTAKRQESTGSSLRSSGKQVKTLPLIDKDRYGELQPSTWYHARMTPNERLTKLKALYKQFAEIVKSQMSYYKGDTGDMREIPEALIDDLTVLESMPSDELMTLAISNKYRERYTGKTLEEETARYTISMDVLNTSRWRDFTWLPQIAGEQTGFLRVD